MSNIVKKEPTSVDGFAGWEDGVEGDDRQQGAGVIQGSVIKFTNDFQWVTRDGEQLSTELDLVAVDIGRVVQKWQDQQPVETIILEPHQKFPDIEEMNNKTPRAEWVEGPSGQPRGPWQAQHIVYLLNPQTMDRYSFPTGTVGGAIATRDLRDRTMWMRRLRGQHVCPVVGLGSAWMKTKFGGRNRPHFAIKRWVNLGNGSEPEKVLPAPSTPPQQQLGAAEKLSEKAAEQTMPQSDLPPVKEPTLAEQMNDEIPTFDKAEDKTVPNAAPRPTARRDLKKPSAKGSAKATSKRRLSNFDAG